MTPASAPLATAKGANAKSARMREVEVNEDMTHDPRKETYRPPMKWQLSLRLSASSQGIKAPLTKTYSQCLGATASQLALASDEMAAAIFKAANVICADQREAIAGVATSQGLAVAEAMDYAEKRGEEAATVAVIMARTKTKAGDTKSAPPQPETVKHCNY
jgi:hypothetical protein